MQLKWWDRKITRNVREVHLKENCHMLNLINLKKFLQNVNSKIMQDMQKCPKVILICYETD